MSTKGHIDRFGILGAAFAALCCLGFSAVLSVVSAVGLGFLIHDAVLLPLLVASLLVTLWGLCSGWKRHHRPPALIIGTTGPIGLIVFSFLSQSRTLAVAPIPMLL